MRSIIKIIFVLVLGSCELVIDVDRPDFQSSIVVGAVLNPDSSVVVALANDRYVLDDASIVGLDGADVELFEDGTLIGSLEAIERINVYGVSLLGLYGIDYRPTPGKTYELRASKSGFESISAVETMPEERGVLSSISHRFLSDDEFNSEALITIDLTDPLGEDFYQIIAYAEYVVPYYDEELQMPILDSLVLVREDLYLESDNLVFEEYLEYEKVFDDNLFDGRTYNLEFETFFSGYYIKNLEELDGNGYYNVTIELRRLSDSYYNYLRTSSLQDWVEGDAFAEAVQVSSNVENGRGFLGGYVSSFSIIEVD